MLYAWLKIDTHIFVGNNLVSTASWLWDSAARNLTVSHEVVFDESSTSIWNPTRLPLPLMSTPMHPTLTPSLTSKVDSFDSSDKLNLSRPPSILNPVVWKGPWFTQRVTRWLYQTVQNSRFTFLLDSSTFGGLCRSSHHSNAVKTNNFVNFAVKTIVLGTPPLFYWEGSFFTTLGCIYAERARFHWE